MTDIDLPEGVWCAALEAAARAMILHQRISMYSGGWAHRCTGCDHLTGETDGPNSPRHVEHQATVALAAALPAVVEAAEKEGFRKALEREPAKIRIENPEDIKPFMKREIEAAESRGAARALEDAADDLGSAQLGSGPDHAESPSTILRGLAAAYRKEV